MRMRNPAIVMAIMCVAIGGLLLSRATPSWMTSLWDEGSGALALLGLGVATVGALRLSPRRTRVRFVSH